MKKIILYLLLLTSTLFATDYYVNDTFTANDIYTTVTGVDTADGLTIATPVATISKILNTYTLKSNDNIYIDNGRYTNCPWLQNLSGRPNKYIQFIGANTNSGKFTVISNNRTYGIRLNNCTNVRIMGIKFIRLNNGMLISNGKNLNLYKNSISKMSANAINTFGSSRLSVYNQNTILSNVGGMYFLGSPFGLPPYCNSNTIVSNTFNNMTGTALNVDGLGSYADGYIISKNMFRQNFSSLGISFNVNKLLVFGNTFNGAGNACFTISVGSLSSDQTFVSNTAYSNLVAGEGRVFYFDGSGAVGYINRLIVSNNLFYNNNRSCNGYLISLLYVSNSRVVGNRMRNNGNGAMPSSAIRVYANSRRNIIKNNLCFSNMSTGISLYSGSNIVVGNAIAKNLQHGIFTSGAFSMIRNNTVWSNGWDGIVMTNTATSSTCRNNIVVGNALTLSGGGHAGIRFTVASLADLSYNNVYGNRTINNTNGAINLGNFSNCARATGGLKTNVLFTIPLTNSLRFLYLSNISPLIDKGSPIDSTLYGEKIDIGYYETGNNGPFYVATNGSDNYYGFISSPFRTIQKSANRMAVGINVTSATAYMNNGYYRERVQINSNANLTKYIVFTAVTPLQAIMQGSKSIGQGFILYNKATNIQIQNLRIMTYLSNGILAQVFPVDKLNIYNNLFFSNVATGVTALCYSSFIRANTFNSNSVYISGGTHIIKSNTFNEPDNMQALTSWGNFFPCRLISNRFNGANQTVYGGVGLYSLGNYTIESNYFNNFMSIHAQLSSNVIFRNNIFTNNSIGLHLDVDKNFIVSKNKFTVNVWQSILANGLGGYHQICSNVFTNSQLVRVIGNLTTNNQVFDNKFKAINMASAFQLEITSKNSRIYRNIFYDSLNTTGTSLYINSPNTCGYENIILNGGWGSASITGTTSSTLRNNLIFKAQYHGITYGNATNCRVFNNTIISNGTSGYGDGINVLNGYNTGRFENNLIGWNRNNAVWVSNNTKCFITNTHNFLFSNATNWRGFPVIGAGNITNQNPNLLSQTYGDGNFMILNPLSPAINKGTNVGITFYGRYPDMGWVEALYWNGINSFSGNGRIRTNTYYQVRTNIIKVKYTNRLQTQIALKPMISIDLSITPKYIFGSSSAPTNWITEFSTNISSDQSYYSSSYNTTEYSNVKWIRWKRPAIGASSVGIFKYKIKKIK